MIPKIQTINVACPAKLNLFLEVAPPDRTGYHPVKTLYQAIGLYDELTVTVGGEGFEVDGIELPEENTITKVLRLIKEVADLPPIGIKLVKRIPAMAGMGGGSSNAAGLIRAVRALLPKAIPDYQYEAIAVSVGADVPFFLRGGKAIGEGYGEKITQIEDESPQWMVVAKPEVGCNTAEMYQNLDRARNQYQGSPPDAREDLPFKFNPNDFLLVAPQACLKVMRQMHELGLEAIGMTGSGSGVFGAASSRLIAERVAGLLSGVNAWAVPTLSQSESVQLAVN